MLIGSRFKRPKAPIELPGKTYFFVPIDPSNPDSEHVAEVTDEEHIQRFMQIPEGYYISKAQALPTASKPAAATPAPPAAATTTTAPPPVDPPAKTPEELQAEVDAAAAAEAARVNAASGAADTSQDSTAPSGLSEELEQAAVNLNALSWQKLNVELNKGGIEKAVVNRALEIELAKAEADQRETTIKILKKNLGIA